jgi:hypothetical protein
MTEHRSRATASREAPPADPKELEAMARRAWRERGIAILSPLTKLGAFDSSNRMAFFEGGSLAAEIDSVEAQLTPGGRTFVSAVHPLIDGGTLLAQVGTRERANDPVAWSGDVQQNVAGSCVVRSSARYHRARVRIAAGGQWKHAQGIEIEAVQEGTR